MSTSYHPQSDGCTERVNQCLEQYLRSMTSQVPKNWAFWLLAAEWWYNTTFHTTLDSSPYQVVYGVKPRHLPWQSREHSNISSLEDMLATKQKHRSTEAQKQGTVLTEGNSSRKDEDMQTITDQKGNLRWVIVCI